MWNGHLHQECISLAPAGKHFRAFWERERSDGGPTVPFWRGCGCRRVDDTPASRESGFRPPGTAMANRGHGGHASGVSASAIEYPAATVGCSRGMVSTSTGTYTPPFTGHLLCTWDAVRCTRDFAGLIHYWRTSGRLPCEASDSVSTSRKPTGYFGFLTPKLWLRPPTSASHVTRTPPPGTRRP